MVASLVEGVHVLCRGEDSTRVHVETFMRG